MVPVPISSHRYPHLLYLLLHLVTQYAPRYLRLNGAVAYNVDSPITSSVFTLVPRAGKLDPHKPLSIVSVVLIPVLVLLSGLFAGLTLGYLSLDETQLNVLSISGTPQQRIYASKIKPIRKNGHLLLVTLLLANMIVNESLPVIADSVLGGGFQSVIVSTVLIVIFAEIIPQSLFTRHGLYLGAKLAGFTKFLIYALYIIAWPVAKILEFALGAHHGVIYRRAELKELIAMHSSHATHGGDLKLDTVTIIGATLDLQEKVVKQAMTPISDVFMLSIDSQLDYALLKKICLTGHSRVPVYEEVDVPISVAIGDEGVLCENRQQRTQKVKKIVGILLVKQCVLLDPKDATPLRNIPLNKVPFVPNNEPLLGILDRFQEGKSHMAIVSRFSVEKAASVKKAVKRGLTQRLRKRVGMGDSESDSEAGEDDNNYSLRNMKTRTQPSIVKKIKNSDLEEGIENDDITLTVNKVDKSELGQEEIIPSTLKIEEDSKKNPRTKPSLQLPKVASAMTSMSNLEQSMPADAVLAKAGAAEFLQGFDAAVMPLGIITLEDVLEELIGEEIYDEFDQEGAHGPYESPTCDDGSNPEVPYLMSSISRQRAQSDIGGLNSQAKSSPVNVFPTSLRFFRTRSAPPVPRKTETHKYVEKDDKVDWEMMDDEMDNELFYSETDPGHVSFGKRTTAIQTPKPIKGTGRYPPSVILEQHSTISSYDSAIPALEAKVTVQNPSSVVNTSAPAPVRLTPPAILRSPQTVPSNPTIGTPTLEAILLERKRRLTSTNNAASNPNSPHINPTLIPPSPAVIRAHSVPGSPVLPSPDNIGGGGGVPLTLGRIQSSGKGTMFKSSPLGGGDRAGVVVSEWVRGVGKSEDLQSSSQVQGENSQGEKTGKD